MNFVPPAWFFAYGGSYLTLPTPSANQGFRLNGAGTAFEFVDIYSRSEANTLLAAKASTGANTFTGTQRVPSGSMFAARNPGAVDGVQIDGTSVRGYDALSNLTWSIANETGVITAVGSGLTSIPAANLTGTVPTGRLGTGTANGGAFLRGDGQWSQTINNDFTVNGRLLTSSTSGSASSRLAFSSTHTNSSGSATALLIQPTDSTTGTGGLAALVVDMLGSGTGSGPKNLVVARRAGSDRLTLDADGHVAVFGTISPGTYTVATLPTAGTSRRIAYASNGRKNGEGAGLGTGVIVFDDGTAWRAVDTGATVAA